jgi:hypothetical protein
MRRVRRQLLLSTGPSAADSDVRSRLAIEFGGDPPGWLGPDEWLGAGIGPGEGAAGCGLQTGDRTHGRLWPLRQHKEGRLMERHEIPNVTGELKL